MSETKIKRNCLTACAMDTSTIVDVTPGFIHICVVDPGMMNQTNHMFKWFYQVFKLKHVLEKILFFWDMLSSEATEVIDSKKYL